MRKLATVRQISEIRQIPNADLLELAIIDGWQAVVKKRDFTVGDRIVYCEIDSFLPVKPEYEFLRNSCYRKLADESEGFRIKTIKLRGQLSQGLVLPLHDDSLPLGTDVTDELGITKYDPTVGRLKIGGDIKGAFPGFIPKTDEERIQNLSSQFIDLTQREWTITEKLDGTSFTCYWYNGTFGVCSRNYELTDTSGSAHWQIAKRYNLESMLLDNIAIQGELVGPGIQQNKYKLEKTHLFVFNVFNIDVQEYYPQRAAQRIALELGLHFVPVVESKFYLPESIDKILMLAEEKSQLSSKTEREGLVFVSDEKERISFKAISNRFLLKSDD